MGNAITQDARAIWLSLVSDGSWWSANSLRAHWSPTFTEAEMQNALTALVGGGFIAKRSQLSATQYAFTSDCKQLLGSLAAPNLSINTGAIV